MAIVCLDTIYREYEMKDQFWFQVYLVVVTFLLLLAVYALSIQVDLIDCGGEYKYIPYPETVGGGMLS